MKNQNKENRFIEIDSIACKMKIAILMAFEIQPKTIVHLFLANLVPKSVPVKDTIQADSFSRTCQGIMLDNI